MHLNRYGRQIGAARDLLEVSLLEEFPQLGPIGIPPASWESGGEWFGEVDGGIEHRRSLTMRGRLVPPPGEAME